MMKALCYNIGAEKNVQVKFNVGLVFEMEFRAQEDTIDLQYL